MAAEEGSSILLLCAGNICRSPMASALLGSLLGSREVTSAGFAAMVDQPADPIAVELMADRGLDISGHRARQVRAEHLTDAGLVLVMDGQQLQHALTLAPRARGRVFRLGRWDDEDIPDPYRGGSSAFEDALALIERGVQAWACRL